MTKESSESISFHPIHLRTLPEFSTSGLVSMTLGTGLVAFAGAVSTGRSCAICGRGGEGKIQMLSRAFPTWPMLAVAYCSSCNTVGLAKVSTTGR
jgi:hypothetical protein